MITKGQVMRNWRDIMQDNGVSKMVILVIYKKYTVFDISSVLILKILLFFAQFLSQYNFYYYFFQK